MKIVAVVGSPHGPKGNTAALVSPLLEAAARRGAETETVYLSDASVLPCLACDVCHRTGNCSRNDDFEVLKGKLLAADGLVLASPNYIFNVSAQMKALLDRCCGIVHCLGFRGKYGATVITSGGGGEEAVADLLNRFLLATGVVAVGSVWATMGGRQTGDVPPDIQAMAADLGKSLVDACEGQGSYPRAQEAIQEFGARMRSLVASRKADWPYEYEYWKALQDTV